MKKCTKCKQEKELTEFSKRKRAKDGLQSQCKQCVAAQKKAYREANKEKIAAQKKAYREANKEEIAAKKKTYYEANKEKATARMKAYYEANKEKIAAYKSRPDVAAREEVRAVTRRAERGDKRSLELYGLPTWEKAVEVREARLAIYKKYFKRKKRHLDHIRPLAEADGDIDELHKRSHFTNLVYIPAEANLSKGATPFWEWFASLDDGKLKKCIAEQDAYNKKIQRELSC